MAPSRQLPLGSYALCVLVPGPGLLSLSGGSLSTHHSLSQKRGEGRLEVPLPTRPCWSPSGAFISFPFTKQWAGGFPSVAAIRLLTGEGTWETQFWGLEFFMQGVFSAPQDGNLPVHSVCHTGKLRLRKSAQSYTPKT